MALSSWFEEPQERDYPQNIEQGIRQHECVIGFEDSTFFRDIFRKDAAMNLPAESPKREMLELEMELPRLSKALSESVGDLVATSQNATENE